MGVMEKTTFRKKVGRIPTYLPFSLFQINFLFLLNILRVLLTKLKNVESSETMKVR
jgi:hypothetical protein